MTRAELRVEGADHLGRDLAHVADQLGDMSEAGLLAANRVAERARQLAPKDTGFLASSIHALAYPDVATAVADAPYAPYVHYGVPSRNIPARPFLTLALEAEAERTIAVYAANLQGLLNRVEGI